MVTEIFILIMIAIIVFIAAWAIGDILRKGSGNDSLGYSKGHDYVVCSRRSRKVSTKNRERVQCKK